MPIAHYTTVLAQFSMPTLLLCALLGCSAAPPSSADDTAEVATQHDEGLLARSIDNALSREEVGIVLKLVDDACGDIWCEGDYDFRFRHLFCDSIAATCVLRFQMGLRDASGVGSDWRWHSCLTQGFSGIDTLVTTSGNYRWLADGYYQALSACIDQLARSGER